MKKKLVIIVLVLMCFSLSGCSLKENSNSESEVNIPIIQKQEMNQPSISPTSIPLSQPKILINAKKEYTATLNTTAGEIKIKLDTQKTPITANNFIYLAQNHFYDNTIFHRTIKDFMIQGGDPKGDGTGGPGYKFDDEPFEGEYLRGTVAMANAGPNTNGSQFFIMHKDYPLPKNYVIFGQVIEGLEVVDKIAEAPVKPNSFGELSTPVNPVKIVSVDVLEK
ncbi:MAG: peptidylprolyl isomerase [Patescibacteria group bacterium]|nr:peptidylprolyl isomerase [Patescibacteria group bacterium]